MALGVNVQKSARVRGSPRNGCPKGRCGAVVTDGSNKLASSLTVGSRQPARPPVVLDTHVPLANCHGALPTGVRCHTTPVSRSSTASLFMFERTMNRVLLGSVWSHDGVA